MKVLGYILLVLWVGGCQKAALKEGVADRLCPVVAAAFESKKFDQLYLEIESAFGIKAADIHRDKNGIYVPQTKRFVTEEGFYISFRGTEVESPGTDPTFRKIAGCIYWYEIKG